MGDAQPRWECLQGAMETIVGLPVEPFLANLWADFDTQLWSDRNQAKIEQLVKVRAEQ